MHSEKIAKVKFRDNGLAGLTCSYETVSMRGGKPYRVTRDETCKAPVNTEVMDLAHLLKEHLRDLCSLKDDLGDEEINIIGISSDADTQFVISAKVRSYGDTWFAVNTPNMKEAMGYGGFEEVLRIISNLYEETRKYIRSDKKVDLAQYALDFAAKDKKEGVMDEVAQMSEEDREKYMIEVLEKKGHIVMVNDFVDPADAEDEPAAEEENDGEMNGLDSEGEIMDDSVAPEPVEVISETGFGSEPAAGKVVPLNQPADKDDVGVARKRARSL